MVAALSAINARFTTVDTNVADVDADLVAALSALNARFTTVDTNVVAVDKSIEFDVPLAALSAINTFRHCRYDVADVDADLVAALSAINARFTTVDTNVADVDSDLVAASVINARLQR